jgi:hypothetical protein
MLLCRNGGVSLEQVDDIFGQGAYRRREIRHQVTVLVNQEFMEIPPYLGILHMVQGLLRKPLI